MDFKDKLNNRKALKKAAIDQAIKGDPICGGYFALLNSHPLAEYLDHTFDYEDSEIDEDDIRPY